VQIYGTKRIKFTQNIRINHRCLSSDAAQMTLCNVGHNEQTVE